MPRQPVSLDGQVLSLDEAIALLESGKADTSIRIDFGGGVIGQPEDQSDLDGLLQRARGVRLIKMIADGDAIESAQHLRSGKPALHPLVEEILDALRQSD
ncbi:hypothetical protein WNY37_08465 [Henriciella sp. AS95]|uniref:hypothetical protein n=1 Tax=Henriciella sp. AS95 TaxID=3135782 RepID=UPI0031740678